MAADAGGGGPPVGEEEGEAHQRVGAAADGKRVEAHARSGAGAEARLCPAPPPRWVLFLAGRRRPPLAGPTTSGPMATC